MFGVFGGAFWGVGVLGMVGYGDFRALWIGFALALVALVR